VQFSSTFCSSFQIQEWNYYKKTAKIITDGLYGFLSHGVTLHHVTVLLHIVTVKVHITGLNCDKHNFLINK